jgi:phosphatidylethanolamine-binding protein (PEBP) family uncharacterized protein
MPHRLTPHRLTQCVSILLAPAAVAIGAGASPGRAAEPFTLTSTAFADGAALPIKYAGADPSRQPPCGGDNVSPPLQWTNAPAATKSFAIVMQDPDGGRGTGSNHWVAYGIPPGKTSLQEAKPASRRQPGPGAGTRSGPITISAPAGRPATRRTTT